MLRTSAVLFFCLASLGYTQAPPLTVISAASTSTDISPESLASVFGANLSSDTAAAQKVPWPASLGGVTVQVTDAVGVTRPAGLLFVSPGQINFQVPSGTAPGASVITVNTGPSKLTTHATITPVAPALFAVDTDGTAAATAIRIPIQTEVVSPVELFDCSAGTAACKLLPIFLAVDAPVYVSFYGTGIHGYSQKTPIQVNVGDETISATYAGVQGQYPGLDQVNVALPLPLRKAGVVDVTLTVDGVTSNPVQIAVQ